MKEFLKDLYFKIGIFFNTIVSALSVLLFSSRKVARKITSLYSVRNVPATVLANGPSAGSIVNERRDLLEGTDILAVNYFANTDSFWSLTPKYYIILDPGCFQENFVVSSEDNPSNEFEKTINLCNNLNSVTWDFTFFVPAVNYVKQFIDKHITNDNIKVVYFNTTKIFGGKHFCHRMLKKNLGLPGSRNVSCAAIQLLANIGYKDIYLYGVEFSWTKTMDVDIENGKMYFNDRHFYSKSEIRYFGKGGYKWWLSSIIEMLTETEKVADYANTEGIRVVNRTQGSFVDAFDYENIQKL